MMTVAQIMRSDVISIGPDASARELARLLQDEAITGVPVRDSAGRVVGVVSSTDLVRLAAEDNDDVEAWEPEDVEPEDTENELASWSYFLAEEPPARFIDMVTAHGPDLDAFTVRDLMTPAPYTVAPQTTLVELAQLLLSNRIHRALVIEDEKLVGIVTTLDVLRSIATAA